MKLKKKETVKTERQSIKTAAARKGSRPSSKKKASKKVVAKKKAGKKVPKSLAPYMEFKSDNEVWLLRLYVAGQTSKSITAFSNLKKICEEHLKNKYQIEIVDLLQTPQLARGDQILALPTLVRQLPPPVKKIIGDLSNTDRVLVGLNLKPLGREVA